MTERGSLSSPDLADATGVAAGGGSAKMLTKGHEAAKRQTMTVWFILKWASAKSYEMD